MHGLRIINSQNSRIITQCEHCQHVMKTTADTLYYLVECPRCFKDFVVKRFKEVESTARVQVQKVRENITHHTPHQDEIFIKTIYNLSWPIYKTAIGLLLIFATFALGLMESMMVPLWCLAGVVALTVLHYVILCAGAVYFKVLKEEN